MELLFYYHYSCCFYLAGLKMVLKEMCERQKGIGRSSLIWVGAQGWVLKTDSENGWQPPKFFVLEAWNAAFKKLKFEKY